MARREFWTVFYTGPLPTGTSEPSPRDKGGLPDGLRHRAPANRHLSAIPAWQRGLPAALRHGNPTHRYLSGILAEPLLVGASDSSRIELRKIHLARAIIDYQVVNDPKGTR